jgi:hypothetical protein
MPRPVTGSRSALAIQALKSEIQQMRPQKFYVALGCLVEVMRGGGVARKT